MIEDRDVYEAIRIMVFTDTSYQHPYIRGIIGRGIMHITDK